MNATLPARHVPAAIRLLEAVDDGQDARHCTFGFIDTAQCPHDAAPGQFFMLDVPGAGESAFTFSRLPDAQGRFGALVRRVGSVTAALFALAPGAVLGARGPFGNGWPMPALQRGRVLVIGGGCGLAPLVSAVHCLQAAGTPLSVLYSARDEEARVLHRERAGWRRDGIPLLEVLDAPHRIGPVPHLDAAIGALGGMPDAVITCGPEAMMFAAAHALVQRGVPAGSIFLSLERRMHCGTGHCGHCYIGSAYCCTDGPVLSWSAARALQPLPHG